MLYESPRGYVLQLHMARWLPRPVSRFRTSRPDTAAARAVTPGGTFGSAAKGMPALGGGWSIIACSRERFRRTALDLVTARVGWSVEQLAERINGTSYLGGVPCSGATRDVR